mmetsp:Transcript_1239/g.1761  ORF Transcript_1239/g.1761 Transcript_1239/m.1761 type:complete len:161 (-) Transcript_1239:922-1404(-)
MVETWPELGEDLVVENGVEVLYLCIIKTLYGCIESALIWYNAFKQKLEGLGFKLNPYNKCVANQTIDGKQCTITWFVDDVKISHESSAVVTGIIKALEEEYGDLKATRGNKHSLLGMDIMINDDGTVSIDTSSYLREVINDFPGEISKHRSSPAEKTVSK